MVEDDEYISRVYERAFRLSGHDVEIVSDGELAWATLSAMQEQPAAIVLDVSLPKMSGTELLEKINADVRFKDIHVIVLTNAFSENIEKSVLAAGADLYLLKIDHEPQDIVTKVDDLIKKSR